MELPQITLEQIQERCTEQSFTRGVDYFYADAISNPVFHDYTLSATCEGTDIDPYRVTVELMPTRIDAAHCSCLYDWGGDCKHIVALLLTCFHNPETILSLEPLFATLASEPSSSLLRIISELLKHAPELVPIVQELSDGFPTSPSSGPLSSVMVYREEIDRLFRQESPEQDGLHHVLIQLEGLRRHAESLARSGETESALSLLHALIHQSIARHSATLRQNELPLFVEKCTKVFTEVVVNAQEPVAIHEHCQMLLQLSFDADLLFTPLLTGLLEQICLTEDTVDLQIAIEQYLYENPDRLAHVQLLLAIRSN
ncbi:hypothetical protein C6502_20475 [Candidatus Poribacteria bacterium]|nr:MAG: hypothetical protein C6502_20475 [Candidatus Poribacteria bacterium]